MPGTSPLPCEVLLTPHPSASGLDAKRRRLRKGSRSNPFLDPDACRTYAADAVRGLDRRLAEEGPVTPSL